MATTPHDGSGTTFSFSGTTYQATDITINNTDVGGDDSIDVSHLGLTSGSSVLTQARPLVGSTTDTGQEVQVEFIGTSAPTTGTEATLSISGGISLSGQARCTASSVRATVNDVIRGSATFRFGINTSSSGSGSGSGSGT